jgi:hypothetical protein
VITERPVARPAAAVLGGCLACLILLGCGRRADLPPVAKVSGVVTLDGKPLPRGTIQFVPDASKGAEGPTAVGTIDPQGHYRLKTAGTDGAIVGFHRVGVYALQQEPEDETAPPPPPLIPPKYFNPETSGLTAEVKAGQDNQLDFPLRSRPQ